jgi:hypothetical protein
MTTIKAGVNVFDPPPGMLRAATITDSSATTLKVQLTETPAMRGKKSVEVPRVFPLVDSSGMFIGSLPAKGTTVTLGQSLGGQYHVLNFEPENNNMLPDLQPGQMLIRSTDTSKILFDLESNIRIGSDISNIHIFAGSQRYPKANLITFNFENENHFTQAFREVGGLVKRDLKPNPQASSYSGSTKLEDDSYDRIFSLIGLDPTATANDLRSGPTKNPPLVEHREIVYEFQYHSDVDDDKIEANKYTTTAQATNIFTTPNRRLSRADTLSLSLVSPNYLIEQVKGTVVDIFGNILDLNRMPLPVGLNADTTLRTNGTVATTDSKKSFINIRALERKSIAFHFEVNSRKDPQPLNQGSKLSINDDNYNAKLQRSRFSFDVDKEGQFKLNVPASSESGNVPLLLRPENYSTFGETDGGNPNQLWFVKSGQPVSQDVYVDSFAAPLTSPSDNEAGFNVDFAHGSIKLVDASTNAEVGPPDRISQFVDKSVYHIRHGTAYHDILRTCSLHQNNVSIQHYQLGTVTNPVDTTYITKLEDLVSTTIKVSGKGANAGGRSGAINMDGSLEMNIGANTIDRQSLWLDTAGGIVANIGRDRNARSAIVNFDGDVIIQVGGYGIVAKDNRFVGANGKNIVDGDGRHIGVVDLRVMAGGDAHMFRIDSKGVTVISPSVLNMYAAQGINIKSDGPIYIDSDMLHLNQRLVRPDGPLSTSI